MTYDCQTLTGKIVYPWESSLSAWGRMPSPSTSSNKQIEKVNNDINIIIIILILNITFCLFLVYF